VLNLRALIDPNNPITPRSQGLRSGRLRNDGSVDVVSTPTSARHPYTGDVLPHPTPHRLPQDIDAEVPPHGDEKRQSLPGTPPRSPKGKEPDIIKRDSVARSTLVSPIPLKQETQPKPPDIYPVRNRIINKAIKAENTLFAKNYQKNGGDNDYRALVDRVGRENAELHKRRARGDEPSKYEWMENARGYGRIIEMMTERSLWTYEVDAGAKKAAELYVVPTNNSNIATYLGPILHKLVMAICAAAVGGAVGAKISLGATVGLLVVTAIGVYMIPTWNAGAQSEAVAGQLQDGPPITPEVSSKQVIRFVPKKGCPGEYERKAVPLRPPVAVKKELVALHAVAREIAKASGLIHAIALLNGRIKAREQRILDLYASKTDWRSMLSPATQIRRSQLKAQINEALAQIEDLPAQIEEVHAQVERLQAKVSRELEDDLDATAYQKILGKREAKLEALRQRRSDLEVQINVGRRELGLIKRTAKHQCMAPDEVEKIANLEDDISMMRGLIDDINRLPDTGEYGEQDAAGNFVQARIAECVDDLRVAKVMEQINYMPNQSWGRGERAVVNGIVSVEGIGEAVAEAVKASATQQATNLPVAATTDQADLLPQPSLQPLSELPPQPSPQPLSELPPQPSLQPLSDLQPQPEPSPEPAWLADEFSPNWTTFGLSLATATIQIGQVARYASNQGKLAAEDQLQKYGGQLMVLVQTAAGDLWMKPNDPESGIDLKRLDGLKRGWLKARYGHMSEIVGFDADVTLMYLFKDLASGDPGPVKVSLAGNKRLEFTDVFLTADDLMDAFKNCANAPERQDLLVQLLTGKAALEQQLKTPDAPVDIDDAELSKEQVGLLNEYTDLVKLSAEVKNGNVDAFFASELIEEKAKQNFEDALSHAILNNTHAGLAGFLTMVTPKEKKQYSKANDWLAHVKGRVEKESMANYYQLVQKRVQQHTHAIFGAASPQLTRSLGTLVAVVLRELGYDLAAAGTLAALNSAAFVMSAVNVSMSFAYHRFIIAKNAQRDMADRLGVRSLPHTGSLKDGGYISRPNPAYYTGEVTDFSRLVASPLNNTAGVKVRYEQQLSPTAMVFKQLWSAAPLNKWRTDDGTFTCGLLHYYAGYFRKAGLDLEVKENPTPPLTDDQVGDRLRSDLNSLVPTHRDSSVVQLSSRTARDDGNRLDSPLTQIAIEV
jgi:hypothetical protein